MVFFLQVFPQKLCTHFPSLSCALHALSISFLIWSLWEAVAQTKDISPLSLLIKISHQKCFVRYAMTLCAYPSKLCSITQSLQFIWNHQETTITTHFTEDETGVSQDFNIFVQMFTRARHWAVSWASLNLLTASLRWRGLEASYVVVLCCDEHGNKIGLH